MGHPAFTTWSDTDHAGAIIIVTVLGLVYWLAPALIQQAISFDRGSLFSWADAIYMTSMLMGIIQAAVLLAACSHGLGKSTSILREASVLQALRLYHASNVFYILVLGLAKCSAALTVLKLTVPRGTSIRGADGKQKTIYAVVTALTLAWMLGSIIVLGVQCEDGNAAVLAHRTTCESTWASWVGIFIADAITDLAIAGFAASIILPTKTQLRLKFLWFMPYTIRLVVIVLAGARLATYATNDIALDPTINIWSFSVLSQIQIFFSLIAAGFPALRKTVLDLVTNFGVSEESANRSGRGPGYILSALGGKSRQQKTLQSNSSSANRSIFVPFTNGDGIANSTLIRAGSKTNVGDDGDSQKGILRHDEFDVKVSFVDQREAAE